MDGKLFEWNAVQQLRLTTLALPFVISTIGGEVFFSLLTEKSAMSRAEIEKLNDKISVLRGESFSGLELCLERGTPLVYGRKNAQVPGASKVGSKKRDLSSSMIMIGKKKSKTAVGGGGSEKDVVRVAERKETRT